jgi:hypothetical protein
MVIIRKGRTMKPTTRAMELIIELKYLINRLEGKELTQDDLDRINAISREFNKLNPKFSVIDFVREDK